MKLEALRDLDGVAGRALLEATVAMGFSEPVARAGLLAELDAWVAPGAYDAVLDELPADLQDGRKPRAVLVIAAGTLPASTLRAVLMARLLGARVLLKPATGQEAIAHALAAAEPEVEPSHFEGSDGSALDAAIARADSVVVLGSDATVDAVQARVPADKAFVGYGHRVSVAWLEAAPNDRDLRGLAEDLCAWDQAGCLSPQVVWCADASTLIAAQLAEHVRDVEAQLPMTLPAAAAPARHAARALSVMLGGTAAETETALLLTLPQAGFRLSPGYRTLWLLPADPQALRAIAPILSTIALARALPPPVSLSGSLSSRVRVCRLGAMQRPPLTWLHDGRPNLLPLLRPGPTPETR